MPVQVQVMQAAMHLVPTVLLAAQQQGQGVGAQAAQQAVLVVAARAQAVPGGAPAGGCAARRAARLMALCGVATQLRPR